LLSDFLNRMMMHGLANVKIKFVRQF